MIQRVSRVVPLIASLVISVCFASGSWSQSSRIDEVPMYGGMDRSMVAELKAADEKFIADVSQQYGSREKASRAWVDQGFRFYQQDNLGMAMRRFNQAWLLDPQNPETYWGFASVLHDQRKHCEAARMIDTAFSKGQLQEGFFPDAGAIYAVCAGQGQGLDENEKQKFVVRSEELFRKAYESPSVSKAYTLNHWARAMAARADFAGAWTKVADYRRDTGKEMDERFLRRLRERMPEPK